MTNTDFNPNDIDPEWIEKDEDMETQENFEFELWLSTDGKHTVRVQANTPQGRTEAMKYAKSVYERIVSRYGTKAEQYTKTNGIQTNGKEPPTCGIHGNPMTFKEGVSKKTGSRYAFWGCPIKNADGSFCTFKNK